MMRNTLPCNEIETLIENPLKDLIEKLRSQQESGRYPEGISSLESATEISEMLDRLVLQVIFRVRQTIDPEKIKNCLWTRIQEALLNNQEDQESLQRESILETILPTIFEAILNTLPDPAFFANEDGICITCNSALRDAFSKKQDAILGNPIWETESSLAAFCQQVKANGGKLTQEVTSSGGIVYRASADTITIGKKRFRFVLIHDLSETRAIGKMSADAFGNAAVAQAMLDGLSHNGRTPMSQAAGAIQALRERDTSMDWLSVIEESIQKLTSLIDRFSETQVENHPLVISIFSPRTVLQEAIDDLGLSKKKEARLDIKGRKKLPDEITSDSEKLKEILQHLIRSALSFAKEDDITIQGSMNEEEEVQFTIEYNGIKASTALQRVLFAGLFEAGENGLPNFNFFVARNLAETIGGRIEVSGNKGKASDTFQLHLIIPTKISHQEEFSFLEQMTEEQLIKEIPENLTIIIENGNDINKRVKAAFIERQLNSRNVKVLTEGNGQITLQNNEIPNLPEINQDVNRKALWRLIIQKTKTKTEE